MVKRVIIGYYSRRLPPFYHFGVPRGRATDFLSNEPTASLLVEKVGAGARERSRVVRQRHNRHIDASEGPPGPVLPSGADSVTEGSSGSPLLEASGIKASEQQQQQQLHYGVQFIRAP